MSFVIELFLELIGELLEFWLKTPRRKAIALAAVGAAGTTAQLISATLPPGLPGWLSLVMLVANLICAAVAVLFLVLQRSATSLFAAALALNTLAFALALRAA